jgi:hypothetical protein
MKHLNIFPSLLHISFSCFSCLICLPFFMEGNFVFHVKLHTHSEVVGEMRAEGNIWD